MFILIWAIWIVAFFIGLIFGMIAFHTKSKDEVGTLMIADDDVDGDGIYLVFDVDTNDIRKCNKVSFKVKEWHRDLAKPFNGK